MDSEKLLSVFANVAVVLPAMVAVLACGRFLSERRQKRLEHGEVKLFDTLAIVAGAGGWRPSVEVNAC
ncbi:hypothetical protein [Sinorhizobium fredii]|uniref:hypothetical protein n=1 Tax=Rhizobium fredii TaxID=380 RepID=UPI0004B1A696|nr:hypothetical protein [Sinorhizobium fredii]